jgi:hypothetical protein
MPRNPARLVALLSSAVLVSGWASVPPEKVQLTLATLHAASLTTSRAAGDSTDAPFFVVAVLGPRGSSAAILPDSGLLTLRTNGAVGARPLTELSLTAGDSVQVLISVHEGAAPHGKEGAYLLGSVSLLLTNEAGTVYWRRLDCVASCKVLTGPGTTALPPATAQPFSGIVEFSGGGGTYHLALRANRAP